ncbi:Pkinase-domain-containing protein [Lepidopterella palustris CBS 459.81]|uniref:non-specific serine/threonine protein kinase n=1 Tax=Lepidopterella palustris CBS 459.81 TaxID=1314670 RepID=A0A8E2EKF4_9PEZI|nr:Pkinase-domain-containing protein [Lepidopterella palustris CBS 459.81]
MEEEATQPSTQQTVDPRRLGRNNSGLNDSDIADVLCILHPASLAAYRIVSETAKFRPQHVLQNEGLGTIDELDSTIEEQETIILDGERKTTAGNDLALRMSSDTIKPYLGFYFGRNPASCDIVILRDASKRISNTHFRIFVNINGILMVEDMSTNGTVVDDVLLKSKDPNNFPGTRMLSPGSIVTVHTSVETDMVKFIVRFPGREGFEEEYHRNFTNYVSRCAIAEARNPQAKLGRKPAPVPVDVARGRANPIITNPFGHGMHWNGGSKYNVVCALGKGAFATVYQLATKMDGQPVAAKELEKRRFMKNGQLDQKLENEMQIMQGLRHPNIVQYIDFHDEPSFMYIMMEYVQFGDLQGYLGKYGNLPESSAKLMARQILHALAYLHQKKITHRDIKPDNILIASMDPFEVKLSDFGLSKVVKNNETFLKTFCGTLLYCAPEVFPQYDAHVGNQGTKRRRGSVQKTNHHSYSQSVDIWSFAAVLWFSLCSSPPFEGVVDANGRGMFNKIMGTDLDVTPLKQNGISDKCIDLLVKMLNTDPSRRPTEQQCLNHPWLYDGTSFLEGSMLNAIAEEEEENGAEEAEEELSQLSLYEKSSGSNAPSGDEEEVDLADDDFKFLLDTHPSKRIKTDRLFPRNQPRDKDELESSPEVSYQSANGGQPRRDGEESFAPIAQPSGRPRLFGEIGHSALQSSGILDAEAHVALSIHESSDNVLERDLDSNRRAVPGSGNRHSSFNGHRSIVQLDGVMSSPSLLGAESMVRELNMASPQSPNSAAATPNEPSTPKTPDVHQHSSLELGDSISEPTPKAPVFNRQISLPKTASFYFDPYDPSTHNLEYASKVSGHDFVAESQGRSEGSKAAVHIPDTVHFSVQNSDNESSQGVHSSNSVPAPDSGTSGFLRPAPRLGKLTATRDSFSPIVLKLDSMVTSWGRLPENTIVYPHVNDVRIPKRAFSIWFHSDTHPDVKSFDEQGKDWAKLEGLHTGITTWTKNGIYVNGVHLKDKDEKGRVLYGRLHSGDVITVFQDHREGTCLKFVCEFYLGAARETRPLGEKFQILKEMVLPETNGTTSVSTR